jgi:hypothetical protein
MTVTLPSLKKYLRWVEQFTGKKWHKPVDEDTHLEAVMFRCYWWLDLCDQHADYRFKVEALPEQVMDLSKWIGCESYSERLRESAESISANTHSRRKSPIYPKRVFTWGKLCSTNRVLAESLFEKHRSYGYRT